MKSGKRRILSSLGLTVGLLSGAVAAYFLAPRKGKDTQKKLVKKANNLSQKSIQKLEEGLSHFELALEDTQKYEVK